MRRCLSDIYHLTTFIIALYSTGCVAAPSTSQRQSAEKCAGENVFITSKAICAAPIGNGCYRGAGVVGGEFKQELITPSKAQARSVQFVVQNQTDSNLYFEGQANSSNAIRLEISRRAEQQWQVIDILENQHCSVQCPSNEPALERDCGPPITSSIRVLPGDAAQTEWNGVRLIGAFQQCGQTPARYCKVHSTAEPGDYVAKACAYNSQQAMHHSNNDALNCRSVMFTLPSAKPIKLRFER